MRHEFISVTTLNEAKVNAPWGEYFVKILCFGKFIGYMAYDSVESYVAWRKGGARE